MAEEKRIDESWKQHVKEEKTKTPQQNGPDKEHPEPEPSLPPTSFLHFVSGLATQAFMSLGQETHPLTGKKQVNLPEAKYLIDIIQMLETKTKGNLSPEEGQALKNILYNLQMVYVSVSRK